MFLELFILKHNLIIKKNNIFIISNYLALVFKNNDKISRKLCNNPALSQIKKM